MIQILNGGCSSRHPSSFRMTRPNGLSNYVILFIHTDGLFQIVGKEYIAAPGYAVILTPHIPYYYHNPKGEYMDDWLHFMPSDEAELTFSALPKNKPFPVRNMELFTFLIQQILWEHTYERAEMAEKNIDALFLVMCNHLLTSCEQQAKPMVPNPYEDQLQLLRLDLRNHLMDQYSIENYAHQIGLSSSYFQHLYKDYFGVSFQKDLIHIRVDQAKYILLTSDNTLEQIAELCGYSNEVHFYRQFKQMTGKTPAKYRLEARTHL